MDSIPERDRQIKSESNQERADCTAVDDLIVVESVVGHAQESGACGDERKNDSRCQGKEGVSRNKGNPRRSREGGQERVFKREKGRWIQGTGMNRAPSVLVRVTLDLDYNVKAPDPPRAHRTSP